MTQEMPSCKHTGPRTVSAVLFDMDGTLTQPHFDFDVIRREIGLPTQPRTPILEAMEKMTPARRKKTEAILTRYEAETAEASILWEDTLPVLSAIRKAGVPIACVTRNSRQSAETVMAMHGLHFDSLYTRDDGPVKPQPDPVFITCERLNADPKNAWMVGDYLFDIDSGRAAGSTTVLMLGDARLPEWADRADHIIRRLNELLDLLAIPRPPASKQA